MSNTSEKSKNVQLVEQYIEKRVKQLIKEAIENPETLDEISLTGLGNIGSKIIGKTDAFADSIANGIESGATALKDKAVNAATAVKDKAIEVGGKINKEYDKGVMTDLDSKIMAQLMKIKEAVTKYNELATKHGTEKINARKYMAILNTIK